MDKLTIQCASWGELYFSEIFDEIYIARSTDLNKLSTGDTVFIGRSSDNNGLQDFVSIEEKKIVKKNCITVSMVGEPRAFYQPYNFTCSQNILILRNDQYLNKNVAIYLNSLINNYLIDKGYGYGYPVGLKRILRNKLVLPLDTNGNPNWQFMEDYIKQEISLQSQSLSSYYEDKMIRLASDLLNIREQSNNSPCFDIFKNINSDIDLYKSDKDCVSNCYKENLFNEIYTITKNWEEKYSLENTEWKEFFIEDVCEINSGKDIYERERIDGNTPYVTATASNNGIGYFISNKNTTYQKNCISVNRNGSVGYSFYHEYGALFGNDTRKLTPKIKDPYIAKFISFMISEQKDKYGYGYKMGTGRLKRQKILLPVQEDITIDYNFMRNYMITREIEIIQNILKRYSN